MSLQDDATTAATVQVKTTCPPVLREQLLSIMVHRMGKHDKTVVAHAVSPCSVSTWPMTAAATPAKVVAVYPRQNLGTRIGSEQQRGPQFLTDEQVEQEARAQGIYSISTHRCVRNSYMTSRTELHILQYEERGIQQLEIHYIRISQRR